MGPTRLKRSGRSRLKCGIIAHKMHLNALFRKWGFVCSSNLPSTARGLVTFLSYPDFEENSMTFFS